MTDFLVILPFIIVILLTVVVTVRTFRYKKSYTAACRMAFIFGTIAVTAYTITLVSYDYFWGKMFSAILFASITWTLYFLMVFTTGYAGTKRYIPPIKYAVLGIIIIDTVTMLCNPFHEMAVGFEIVNVGSIIYYQPIPKFLFACHLALCYAMVGCIFYIIIKKTIKTPAIYRKRYSALLAFFVLVLLLNAIFLFTDVYLDYSILTYPIFGWILYYFAFEYVPDRFLVKTKSRLIEYMDDTIVIFDYENKPVYYNVSSKNYFRLKDKEIKSLEDFVKTYDLCDFESLGDKNNFEYRIGDNRNGRYFSVEFTKMYDRKKQYTGCFFVFHETTEKKLLEKYDHLTGIYNIRSFYKATGELLREKQELDFSIVYLDIFGFKIFNEIYGNDTGDAILTDIAESIRELSEENITYGRMSGDKFAVCVETEKIDIDQFKKILISKVMNRGIKRDVKLYFGIYNISDKTEPVEHMCEKANIALNNVKGSSIARSAIYDSGMREELLMNQELINDMNIALQSGQFEVFFQPQYDYKQNKLIGAEALVRWDHPEEGYISPGKFIPIFEKNGFIAKLDEYVWECSCMYLRDWIKTYGDNTKYISVNISRIDMYYMDICEKLTTLTEKYNIPRELLKLEFTESAYIEDGHHMIDIIEELRNAGFVVEMDDFGSGYSSLNALKDVPVDVIKLDMNFIKGYNNSKKVKDILRSVVYMINAIELNIVAEGVETKEQADFLSEIGCDVFQGYYFSRPVPKQKYELLLKSLE